MVTRQSLYVVIFSHYPTVYLTHFIISVEIQISIWYFEYRKLREIKFSENTAISIQLRPKKKYTSKLKLDTWKITV